MYADVESRGGILEPPGICEVKFRAADQISKMHEVSWRAVGLAPQESLVGQRINLIFKVYSLPTLLCIDPGRWAHMCRYLVRPPEVHQCSLH